MEDRPPALVWLLVLLPLILAAALGLSPRPAGLDQAFQSARLSLEGGAAQGAARSLQRVAAYLPWRVSIWEQAGISALEAGDPAGAVDFLRAATGAGHISASGRLALGDALWATGERRAAEASWKAALGLGHNPEPVLTRLLEYYQQDEDYPAAISVLQALAEIDPQESGYRYQLGLLLAAREPQAALAFLLEAAELDTSLLETVQDLEQDLAAGSDLEDPAFDLVIAGRALARLGEWDLAREAFRQATQVNPTYAEAWAFLGEAQQQGGQPAQDVLDRALALDPGSLAVNLLYGMFLKRNGEFDRALAYLETAAQIDPQNPAIQVEIAGALAGRGDINGAIDSFLQAIEYAPENPAFLLLLARFSIFNEIQVDEIGLPAARRALIINPDDPIGLDLIGYAYYLRSDPASAQRFLLQSLQANPNYAPARLHLGLVYLEDGRLEPAIRQLQQAIQLAPGTGTALQAAQIIERYAP